MSILTKAVSLVSDLSPEAKLLGAVGVWGAGELGGYFSARAANHKVLQAIQGQHSNMGDWQNGKNTG